MTDMTQTGSGYMALVGSGEFLDVMNETDRLLMQRLDEARVAIIPTASGLEAGMPQHWASLGVSHFKAFGLSKIETVMLIERQDASDPAILDTLQNCNFFYFSGGNPLHLVETLRDTPAWQLIRQAFLQGASLAGCSAGAMAFGAFTPNINVMRGGSGPLWLPALNLLPALAVVPHFDRMRQFISPANFKMLMEQVPHSQTQPVTILGIDEDTALVRQPNIAGSQPGWLVSGRQTVSVYSPYAQGEPMVYRSGEVIELAADPV